ncbi:MAG: hypothetical protein EKK41_22245 [Hyphomicrobiales bacterium]|nr:MAG: hypothetical protein EKK41_22245 [Hyphomicrobiales bacterium]
MLKRVDEAFGAVALPSVLEVAAFHGVSREQTRIMFDEVAARLRRELQRLTLSRGGLADAVLALKGQATDRDGEHGASSLSALVLGPPHAARVFAAHIARRARVSPEQAEALLPVVVEEHAAAVAKRAEPELYQIHVRIPAAAGGGPACMYAEISEAIRTRAGAGPFRRKVLVRRVRAAIADAAQFPDRGPMAWLAQGALTPFVAAWRTTRPLLVGRGA